MSFKNFTQVTTEVKKYQFSYSINQIKTDSYFFKNKKPSPERKKTSKKNKGKASFF